MISLSDKVEKLIEYVMKEDKSNVNSLFPYISSELLQIENEQIVNWFFPDKQLEASVNYEDDDYMDVQFIGRCS